MFDRIKEGIEEYRELSRIVAHEDPIGTVDDVTHNGEGVVFHITVHGESETVEFPGVDWSSVYDKLVGYDVYPYDGDEELYWHGRPKSVFYNA